MGLSLRLSGSKLCALLNVGGMAQVPEASLKPQTKPSLTFRRSLENDWVPTS